jgi:transcriptional antiterminator RfaH
MLHDDFYWLVGYTLPRREKQVALELQRHHIEYWLPLSRELRQWSDRKKWVDIPLFPSYIFVKTTPMTRETALKASGMVRWLRNSGKEVTISLQRMEAIQQTVELNENICITETMPSAGIDYKITSGPFSGSTGKIIEIRNNKRLVIELAELNRYLILPFSQSN